MTEPNSPTDDSTEARRLAWAGLLLGIGLGGFFDGILLHQILQWHHLLSGVQSGLVQDIRVQILADGVFHALMYVIAAGGLYLLWRARRGVAARGADRRLIAFALIGFGTWHVLDAFLSHWILGIHRIRMDVDNKLAWDLGWFAVFGVAVILAGWLTLRRGGGSGGMPRAVAPGTLGLAVLIAGPVAALPPPGVTTVMVLFRPGMSESAMMSAMAAVDGRMAWRDPSGQLWAIDVGPDGDAGPLYRHGALLVGNGLLPVACLNWSRI
ncbi:DUF2243 domain-containing protein [Marinivivus vitaminiproducens]|uniref:DUF2243 domain-containing protein n=1 Tax=Marinivivus vitaminiproducens TaxID=3035935 RepID=UPI0027A6C4DD|nr:DUF2243 domain-containing protein [Geminicoccaceae bacterium SCSIO 64248]